MYNLIQEECAHPKTGNMRYSDSNTLGATEENFRITKLQLIHKINRLYEITVSLVYNRYGKCKSVLGSDLLPIEVVQTGTQDLALL